MNILLDTNILISAIVFLGRPMDFLSKLKEDGHALYVSDYIEEELRGILRRKWPRQEEKLWAKYRSLELRTLPSVRETYGKLRDEHDAPILSDAIAHHMDVILTGDKDFLEAGLSHPKAMSISALSDYLDKRT